MTTYDPDRISIEYQRIHIWYCYYLLGRK